MMLPDQRAIILLENFKQTHNENVVYNGIAKLHAASQDVEMARHAQISKLLTQGFHLIPRSSLDKTDHLQVKWNVSLMVRDTIVTT
jgi:hypothetical protein